MKTIIACRRNPALSRAEFLYHLRHAHWPLIQAHPAVERALGGYIQNHALGEASPSEAPFRVATERDSVIELIFGPEGHAPLLAAPGYMEHIRPDETHMADRAANVVVRSETELFFEAAAVGRCKRFDFLRRAGGSRAAFLETLAADARLLALDPAYTGRVDRHAHNDAVGEDEEEAFDCVREVWAGSFEALASVAAVSELSYTDANSSFSVYATEFVIKPCAAP